ncbi:MAG: hypothetical protein ACLFV2_05280 [Desulfurivibrionaceae bacterium]
MKKTVLTKAKKQTAAREEEKIGLDAVSKASLIFMVTVSAVIGIWAVISFVSVMARVGPLEFFRSWFQAVTGM